MQTLAAVPPLMRTWFRKEMASSLDSTTKMQEERSKEKQTVTTRQSFFMSGKDYSISVLENHSFRRNGIGHNPRQDIQCCFLITLKG